MLYRQPFRQYLNWAFCGHSGLNFKSLNKSTDGNRHNAKIRNKNLKTTLETKH